MPVFAKSKNDMIEQKYADIVTPELLEGAIENNEFTGFREDYHVLHCLLRKYSPKSFLEIGCNMGRGTKIIKNALGPESDVYSLDLPTELAHISLQHPINEGHGDRVGHLCDLPFTLLRGDSMEFNFAEYPCEGYYIDGEHTTNAVRHETKEILKLNPNLVIYHDSDMPVVMQGILEGLELSKKKSKYELWRVVDTRIAYLVKK